MQPIDAVLFDFHQTLVDASRSDGWLSDAWVAAGRPGTPEAGLGTQKAAQTKEFLANAWGGTGYSQEVDPTDERDRRPGLVREVWHEMLRRFCPLDEELGDALLATMAKNWIFYDDAIPVLRRLRAHGVKIAIVSNMSIDIRPTIEAQGALELFDAILLSFEVGQVKPEPEIFQTSLDAVGTTADRALMVGDSFAHDGGAALVGVRTLILPRTDTPDHGLDAVLRIVGIAPESA